MNLEALLDRYLERYPEHLVPTDHIRLLVRHSPDALLRTRLEGHLTASAWVWSPDRQRVVLVHHKKLDRWLQPGGHADGDPNLAQVARREVEEETGLVKLTLMDEVPLDLDVHLIPKRPGVPAHLHHDVRFLFHAHEETLRCSEESNEVRWFTNEEVRDFDESVTRLGQRADDYRGR